jgi:glutamyl/glutaminyl-tRNA synthetase
MTILEVDYGIPSEDELARLVGAATPHFALQIRDRVRAYADALPEDHPRRPGIEAQIARLEALAAFTAEAAEAAVRAYAQESGAKLGQVAQPLRAALTGRSTSPGIFDVLQVLGREESLGRIRDQI